jgi:hypothetical protein
MVPPSCQVKYLIFRSYIRLAISALNDDYYDIDIIEVVYVTERKPPAPLTCNSQNGKMTSNPSAQAASIGCLAR